MSEEQDIRQLMRDGIEAARAGDKATARDKFEQITELDENNEKAWFWLASVVETDEEKRVCLNNVLVINPDNERARQILERLQADDEPEDEVVPGISRRQLMMIAGGGALVVVVLLGIVLLLVINNNNQRAAEQAAIVTLTQEVANASASQTAISETQIAAMGTDTPTPRSNVLPTELPPTETVTATATEFRFPPPPASVAGVLATWGGRDVLSNGALEPRIYPISDGGQFSLIGDELGRDVRFAGDASRVVYTRYFPSTFDFGLELVNVNGTQPQVVQTSTIAIGSEQPDLCSVANRLVFVGAPLDRPTSNEELTFESTPNDQVFIIDLDRVPPSGDASEATIRITNDAAAYSFPAFSPDCSQIAVVRNDINSAQPGADIVLVDVETRNVTPVTTDLTTFAEKTPRWSPDGTQIIFSAAPATDPGNGDIILVNANGSGVPTVLVRDAADDVYPVISPDGQYVAFSSNRQGAYNVFIKPLFSEELWQLTATAENEFVGGWR